MKTFLYFEIILFLVCNALLMIELWKTTMKKWIPIYSFILSVWWPAILVKGVVFMIGQFKSNENYKL